MLFKTSKFFLHAAVFAVAIVTTSTLFPFIVGKYVWFRAMVDLALIAFFAGLIFNPDAKYYIERLKRLARTPAFIAISAFVFIFVLSGFFGVRPSFSFWSNFERGEGGLQLLHLYAFFVLLVVLFRDEKDWLKIFRFSIVAAGLMILYGIIAGFGWSILGNWGSIGPLFNSEGFRFQGSIGNAAYVSGYLIFILFFAFYILLRSNRSLRSPQSIGLMALMGIFFVFSLMSGTRGAFLGMVAGLLVALAYIGWRKVEWRKWLLAAGVMAVLVVALLIQFQDLPAVQNLPGSSVLRVFQVSLEEQNLLTRFATWGIALDAWQARPLLGWGPENFLVAFDKHYDIEFYDPAVGFGAWYDRAHSTVFDYLSMTGVLGLLGYLAAFVTITFLPLRAFRARENQQGGDTKEVLLRAAFLAILVTYFVQGLVLFDVLVLYLPLFMLFAFAIHYFYQEKS